MLPINELFAQYHNLADKLIDEINATPLTLVYNIGNTTTGPSPTVNSAFAEDVHGNLMIPQDTAQINSVVTSQENILVRSYWNSGSDSKFPADLRDRLDVVKINFYTTDTTKFLNASYYILNGVKCKRIRDIQPYGFGKRYSTVYLEKYGDSSV